MADYLAKIDRPLLATALLLFAAGILILASASMAVSQKNFGTPFYYVLRQLLYGGFVGIISAFLISHVPYRFWRKAAVPLMIVSFIFLALLFIPDLSYSSGGARRWLNAGFFSFQPSEILKLSFIIYLASWLDSRRGETSSFAYGFIPFSLMLAIVGLFLIMQPDLGTLGVVVLTSLLLYFLGGGKASQIVTLVFFGMALFYFLVQLAPYRLSRVAVFLNPGLDPQGAGYQINQALIAIGSGGFWGEGLFKGLQKYSYLPEPMGDSVFAVFAEEAGFFGAALMMAAFLFLLWRGFWIAKRAPDIFGSFLAAGITIATGIQVFVNTAAISGLLPLTGIPLPFISYGGTSLATTLIGLGILLNISKHI